MNSTSFPSFHVCDYKQSQEQLKYIPLPACLPCPPQREETNTATAIRVVPGQEGHAPCSDARPMSRSDRKTSVSCHFVVTELFQKAAEKSWGPCCECFHFLDGNVCSAICSKERAFPFGRLCGVTVPEPLASFRSVCI